MANRNRLGSPGFPDEPDGEYSAYQRYLDEAYDLMHQDRLDEAHELLNQHTHLPESAYQRARTAYIHGNFFQAHDQSGIAADYFADGASAAIEVRDWALIAQLKDLESGACFGATPAQFLRAFEASRDAWKAWRVLPDEDETASIQYAFHLADILSARAYVVADDETAYEALQWSSHNLFRLQGRPGVVSARYANDDLFLEWNWAIYYRSHGDYRRAFTGALKARKKGAEALRKPVNRGRLHILIAEIALDCVDEAAVEGYSRKRLLNVADAAIERAYAFCKDADDQIGYGQTLLADARCQGLSRVNENRAAKITEAETIGSQLNSEPLACLVGIAWGDELAAQSSEQHSREKADQARAHYQQVVERATALEAFNFARIARRRLSRLPPLAPPTPAQTPTIPPPGGDYSPN